MSVDLCNYAVVKTRPGLVRKLCNGSMRICTPGPGRPKSPDSLRFVTVGLTPAQWDWLSLWFPTGSPTHQLSALFERALKFWPAGPFVFRGGAK